MHAADADGDDRPEVVRPAERDEELPTEPGLVVDERLDEEAGDRGGPPAGPASRRSPRSPPGTVALDDGDPADVRLVGDAVGDDLHDAALAAEAGELPVGDRRRRVEDEVTRDRDPEGAEEAIQLRRAASLGPPGAVQRHAADHRRAPGRARRQGEPGHLWPGVRGRHDLGRGHARRSRAIGATTSTSRKVLVSVFAYNSKVYYVITRRGRPGRRGDPLAGHRQRDGAGCDLADQRFEPDLSSKNIWIARPARLAAPAATRSCRSTGTRSPRGRPRPPTIRCLPGDRIFIAENKLIAIDAVLNQVIAPFERIFGVTLLGTQTIQTINRFPLGLSGNSQGF